MEYFLQQLINGVTLGAIYGLIAIGYTMVYGIIGMINFAHGDIFMVGAFIGLIALINGILGGVGGWFGFESLSLELILGWLFAPLAFLLGVPWEEATLAGSFIGQKLVVNEFVAYINLAPYIDGEQVVAATGQLMTPHTMAILSFALCGFANLSSIAILLGGLGSIAPTRRKEIARFGVKAVLAGTLSNLMSASIAGFFIALSSLTA